MAPEIRVKELETYFEKKKDPKKAAVLAMFYPGVSELTHFLLILRKKYPGVHSNQVGFPGGQLETQDRSLMETALRETEEEVGARSTEIEIIRPVSELYIPPSNFQVQPYMGLHKSKPSFELQDSEVERLVEVPLTDFLNDRNIITTKMTTSYATNIDVPAYNLKGYTVWGATAMMLSEIRELLKQVL